MKMFKKPETVNVSIKGKQLSCPVCGNSKFTKRSSQLNTRLATFFNLDWANRVATCYICTDCSHVSWFLGKQ